jgi:hypothetical protein
VKIHLCQVIFHHNDVILSALIITLQGSELIKIVKIEGTVLHKAILTSHGEYSFQGSPKQSFALLTKLTESFFNNPNCSYYKERLQNEISPKKKYIGESLGGFEIHNSVFSHVSWFPWHWCVIMGGILQPENLIWVSLSRVLTVSLSHSRDW